jgi:hypothetical protein
MDLIKEYRKYRKIGMELNHKIMDTCLAHDVIMGSAQLLGILHGETLIFESEDESSVLMDFALNDYPVNNQNTMKLYRDTKGWENEIEKEILDAHLVSYTSLFKVISISKEEYTLLLRDLLNAEDTIQLIDINFSRSAVPGVLLFTRIIPLKDFNMTSGVSFAFPGHLEQYLLKRYRVLSKKVKSDNKAVRRFVSFYKLSKTKGIEVQYK